MQTDVYIKIINEKMNMEFWMAGFLVIPKVYAVIASPFSDIFQLHKIMPNFCQCVPIESKWKSDSKSFFDFFILTKALTPNEYNTPFRYLLLISSEIWPPLPIVIFWQPMCITMLPFLLFLSLITMLGK